MLGYDTVKTPRPVQCVIGTRSLYIATWTCGRLIFCQPGAICWSWVMSFNRCQDKKKKKKKKKSQTHGFWMVLSPEKRKLKDGTATFPAALIQWNGRDVGDKHKPGICMLMFSPIMSHPWFFLGIVKKAPRHTRSAVRGRRKVTYVRSPRSLLRSWMSWIDRRPDRANHPYFFWR